MRVVILVVGLLVLVAVNAMAQPANCSTTIGGNVPCK
jgi:hypothetical protein